MRLEFRMCCCKVSRTLGGTRVTSLQILRHCRSAMRACGWMCSMRLRPPKARRSRRRTARALCGGWQQGNRRTRFFSSALEKNLRDLHRASNIVRVGHGAPLQPRLSGLLVPSHEDTHDTKPERTARARTAQRAQPRARGRKCGQVYSLCGVLWSRAWGQRWCSV